MTNNIKVVYLPINNLNPSEYNPRKHTTEQANQLKESIKRFGFVDPIICNSAKGRENIVIGGHFRLEIAKELNITEVPVVFVSISDLEKEQELNVRLNKNTGEIDFEKLQHLNFDMLLDIGFDQKDLDDMWNSKLNNKEFIPEVEIEKIKEPTTKTGDIIQMDGCKLICGDSTLPETLHKLFGEERASMIMSDPIYNISIDYNGGISGSQNYGGTVSDNKSDKEYENFLRKSMVAALAVIKDDAHVFYWSDEASIWQIQVLCCTRMNDIILDSFSGSGSTIMAGIKLKRKVYAVEIEPKFCDLTIRRYEALTGKKAKVIRNGEKG